MRTSQAVRQRSMKVENHEQRPYLSSDLNGNIYLQRHRQNRQRRIAITVSMDNHGTLNSSNRNIAAWSKFLEIKCGFEVKQLNNPNLRNFRKIISEPHFSTGKHHGNLSNPLLHRVGFSPETEQSAKFIRNTLLVFIFAGSGVLLDGIDYLVTNDVDIKKDKFITKDMIPFREIQTAMRENSAASVLILDTQFQILGSEFR